MSLNKFLDNKDVRAKFTQEFPKPEFGIKRELLAPPLSPLSLLVGTAFHYLLGFYVEYLNPKAIAPEGWVAEWLFWDLDALEIIGRDSAEPKVRIRSFTGIGEPDFMKLDPRDIINLQNKVRNIISEAKQNHSIFLQNGVITDNLIRSASLLAPLDEYHRREVVDKNIGLVDEKIVEDLKKMISLVDAKIFKANEICILSPTFGEASLLIGGADADLIIDDMLIEIKTSKKLELQREYLNQLIGYYALYKIGGVNGMTKKHEIKRFGIYFSRYGYLHAINISDIIDIKTFSGFLKWFKEKAKEMYSVKY